MTDELARRLAARTLELVDVPSESRHETAILERLRVLVPPERFTLVDEEDAALLFLPDERRREAPLVLLAGHVDTVPAAGNVPGRIEGDAVVGRGACDMKGSLAVMLEVAQDAVALAGSDLDVGLLFVGREELPITESALLPLLARCPAILEVDLAIVMEPTANALEVGCMGNLNATIRSTGRAAHSARPWLGENAIHSAIEALAPLVDLPTRDVEIDGLVFREVVSVTRIEGGGARNVIPDRVEAQVNLRYAPNHTPAEAEARLRELLGPHPVEIEIVGNAPPGSVPAGNQLVDRLRDAGGLGVGPKQAWTPVAEFATAGIDAVNLGPGDPQYAHRDDERVEVAALTRSIEIVRAFLAGTERDAEDG
jgi:succinyl-diaminopimelate desuccinylase